MLRDHWQALGVTRGDMWVDVCMQQDFSINMYLNLKSVLLLMSFYEIGVHPTSGKTVVLASQQEKGSRERNVRLNK